MNRFKRTVFFIEMFWNILNVFTFIFDQFNVSLLNRSITFFFFFFSNEKIWKNGKINIDHVTETELAFL